MCNTVGVGVVQHPETKAYLAWIVLYGNRLAYIAAYTRFEAAVTVLIARLEAEAEMGEVPAEIGLAIVQSQTETRHQRN